MLVDKDLINKVETNLRIFSLDKVDEINYVLQNINNELQIAHNVVSIKESKYLSRLYFVEEDFFKNHIPKIITKSIDDFFGNNKSNINSDLEKFSKDLTTSLLSNIAIEYKKYLLDSLDILPEILTNTNYLSIKLSSNNITDELLSVQEMISNKAFELMQKNPASKNKSQNNSSVKELYHLSETSTKIENLNNAIKEVLSSSNRLNSITNDTVSKILKKHYDNKDFNKKIVEYSKNFTNIAISLIKQRDGHKELERFIEGYSNYINSKIAYQSGILENISNTIRDTKIFLKQLISIKQRLSEDDYKRIYDNVVLPINKFLKELDISSKIDKKVPTLITYHC